MNMNFSIRHDLIGVISQATAQFDRAIDHYDHDLSKLKKEKEQRRVEHAELSVLRGKLRRMGSF